MKAPTLDGVIERRLLINYRVDPAALEHLVPDGFRPQLVRGSAVAGICLLRLGSLRPVGVPRWLGLRSENAAHRIAVEWDTPEGISQGVYIPRRDSGSLTNVIVGGRLFPGVHHRAEFAVEEKDSNFSVKFRSLDGSASVSLEAVLSKRFNGSRLFTDLAEASAFFQGGSLGYSDSSDPCRLDGLRLETADWDMEAVDLRFVRSSFFSGEGPLTRTLPIWTAAS